MALAALALGGSAIASAMNDNSSSPQTSSISSQLATSGESESGPEGADDNGSETGPEGTDDNESGSEGTEENEGNDPSETVSATVNAKASAAAEAATGGSVQEVTIETNDAPEKGDSADPGEQASPAGTAYEADVSKGSKELKVSMNDQFKVLQVQAEQSD